MLHGKRKKIKIIVSVLLSFIFIATFSTGAFNMIGKTDVTYAESTDQANSKNTLTDDFEYHQAIEVVPGSNNRKFKITLTSKNTDGDTAKLYAQYVINKNFKVVSTSESTNSTSATISYDDKNTVLNWNDFNIQNNKVWTITINIEANSDFVGGSNIPINVIQDNSYICKVWYHRLDFLHWYPQYEYAYFDRLSQSVGIDFSVKDFSTDVKYGQTVNLDSYKNSMFVEESVVKPEGGTFTYEWFNDQSCSQKSNSSCLVDQIINKYLKVTYKHGDAVGSSVGHLVINTTVPDYTTIETKKNVSLVDWENRIYKIDLYASNKQQAQETKPLKVALTLDFSGSMWYNFENTDQTKIVALKESVRQFLNKLPSDSYVTTNAFSGKLRYSDKLTKLDKSNIDAYVNKIFDGKGRASDGTDQLIGLKKSMEQLGDLSEEDVNVIVLFTDGKPEQYYDDGADADDIKSYINKNIKPNIDNGKLLFYGVGVFGKNESEGRNNLKDWINNDDNVKLASNATELGESFENIAKSISNYTFAMNIKDVIDPRFSLINTADYKSEVPSDYDGSNDPQTVKWTNQKISYCSDLSDGINKKDDSIWHKTIYVQAKDEYIGGNDVPTNTASSGIYLTKDDTNSIKTFEQPTVNVKCIARIKDISDVFFDGETTTISRSDVEKLIQTTDEKGTELLGKDGKALDLSDFKLLYNDNDEWKTFNDDTTISVATDKDIDIKAIYDVEDVDDDASCTKNSDNKKAAGTAYNSDSDKKAQDYATYSIKIVKGEIDLSKAINEKYTHFTAIKANQPFIFKIEQYDADSVENGVLKEDQKPVATFYETFTFDQNSEVNKSYVKKIEGLKKGYYTVTEEADWSCAYNQVHQNDDYESNKEECKLIFIGDKLDTSNGVTKYYGLGSAYQNEKEYDSLYTGEPANVSFVNNKKDWKWMSDVTALTNKFRRINSQISLQNVTGGR